MVTASKSLLIKAMVSTVFIVHSNRTASSIFNKYFCTFFKMELFLFVYLLFLLLVKDLCGNAVESAV